jgi:hypothetical protein
VHDLWFEWTVPQSGRLRLISLEPGVGASLYRGDRFLTLQPVFPPGMNFTRGDRIVFRVCCGSNVIERPLLRGELDASHLIWEPTATLYREPVLLTFVPDPDYPAPTNVSFPSTNLVGPPWQGVTYFGLSTEKTPVTARYADGRIEDFFATGKASLPNDNFADAAVVPNDGILVVERIALATREPNEPVHSSEWGTNDVSVWWRWRPSRDSYLRVRYDYSTKNHVIYRGNSITGLTRVYPLTSVHGIYPMEKDGEYRLAAFSRFDEQRGNIWFDFLEPEQNDWFGRRTKLAVEGAVTGKIAPATIEQGEPLASGSLWYEWSAPAKGEVRFDILNPEDVLRYVDSARFVSVSCYAGTSLADLNLLPFDSNSDSAVFRKVVESGERLFVRVTGVEYRKDIDRGLFILKWAFDPAPPNDLFKNRTQIESLPFTASYNSKWTTFETGEARLSGSSALLNTAWWEWTARTSEPVSLSALSGDIPLRSRAVVKCFTGEGLD